MQQAVAILVLFVALLAGPRHARAQAVEGRWLTQSRTGVVDIYRCGDGALCGRLVWVRLKPSDNNKQALDIHNPDAALRTRSLCGLVMMWGLKPDGQNHWDGGAIYDPVSGNTYHANMTLQADGTLSLRGYVGIPMLGRSQQWTRFTGAISACPAR